MSLTVETLQRTWQPPAELQRATADILRSIDEQILLQHRDWGSNRLEVSLPVCFNIPGISATDSQRVIYAVIIKSLKERGFKPRLKLLKDRAIIFIEWELKLTEEKKEELENHLRQALKYK